MENKCITNIQNNKQQKIVPIKKGLDDDEECGYFDASQLLEVQVNCQKEEKMEENSHHLVKSLIKNESVQKQDDTDVLNGWVIENGNYVNKLSEVELRPIINPTTKELDLTIPKSALPQTNTVDKPYECSTCGNRFTRKDHLRRHEQGHLGVTPFECQECGKSFNRKDRLTRHMLIHSGDSAYQCEVCSKIFNRKDHMVAHKRSHFQAGSLSCDYCNKTFSRKDHLVKHKKSHTNKETADFNTS